MHTNDAVELVEAAYAMDTPHERWQHRLTELAAAQWDGEAGSIVYDLSEPTRAYRESFIWVGSEKKRAAFMAMAVPEYPIEIGRMMLSGPHLSSVYESLAALRVDPASLAFLQNIRDNLPEFDPDWFSHGVTTKDPSHRGLQFAFSARPITARMRRDWARLASHVAIAYRLRRKLAEASAVSAEPTGEAVIGIDGRCHHAEGDARTAEAREILRAAARSIMRARGSLRRREPDEALEIWRGLVDGRWSLVDRFDGDGKHYLIAHKNPPNLRDHRALSPREAQVAAYLAMGLSNKVIAYALGVETTTVASHVVSIERKLNAGSRTELTRLLAAFHALTGDPDATIDA